MATGEEQRAGHLPQHILNPPHDNWEFNIFLDKLACNVDDEELDRLKRFEYGPGGIRKKLFEEIKTAHQFFMYLREMTILTVDNLVHLQALLWHLERKDLVKECANFAETLPNTLYFHQPLPEPVNGYRHAAFHVEGKDLGKYKREDLEKLRNSLSRRLCVPHEFIIISGLTPSKSLVITVMIPVYNAELLVELLQENRITELAELGIDSVLINGQTFIISEKSSVLISKERNETAELVEKLERSQSLLEQCNIDLLRLREKLQTTEEKLRNSIITERNLTKVTNDMSELLRMQEEMLKNGYKQQKSLQTESALAYFRFAMNKVKESGHDTEEVMTLLEANTYFISSKTRDSCRHVLRILINSVEDMKLVWATQMFEVMMSRLALMTNKQYNVPESEIDLRNKHGLPTGLSTGLDDLLLRSHSEMHAAVKKRSEMLRRYSLELSDKDIAKLRICLPYDWTTDENNLVESDRGEFLELVLKKEILKQGKDSIVNISSFLCPLFEKIHRKDLANKFHEEKKINQNDLSIKIDMKISQGELNKGTSREKSTREENNPKENDEIKKHLQRIEQMVTELYDKRNRSDIQKKLFELMLPTQERYMDFNTTLMVP